MILILGFVGLLTGFLSGFFGVGGGQIAVPLLVFFGLNIKNAVGISVIQMMFGSVYGSYLNHKHGNLDLKRYSPFLIGGIFGGFIGAYFSNTASEHFLYILFLCIVSLAIIRVFFSPAQHSLPEIYSPLLYIAIGMFIGMLSGMIGVGGAILMTPILVGFLNFSIKKAISVSLYFVIASSISALIGLSYFGHVDYMNGLIAAITSLFGVWAAIHLGHKINSTKHKFLLLLIYFVTFSIMVEKLFQ